MRPLVLEPFVRVDDVRFSCSPETIVRQFGQPQRRTCDNVGLDACDYGDRVLRFQPGGRLEEITVRTRSLQIDRVIVPPSAIGSFLRRHDDDAFERAGFLVSPRYGLAFVTEEPRWITALARHCIPTWRALA